METFEFNQYRPRCCTVHVGLFRSVSNTTEILSLLKQKGNEAFPIQLALIDASYIVSREHLLVAIHQSMLSYSRSLGLGQIKDEEAKIGTPGTTSTSIRGMKTKSIHSEILWNLSISTNIMDSFRTFGVSEKTKDVIAIHVADEDGQDAKGVLSHMIEIIKGTLEENGLKILNHWRGDTSGQVDHSPTNWDEIRKVYKLTAITDKHRIDSIVTSLVAMKNVAAS